VGEPQSQPKIKLSDLLSIKLCFPDAFTPLPFLQSLLFASISISGVLLFFSIVLFILKLNIVQIR